MKPVVCENCGAGEFEEKGGYKVCAYCGFRYKAENRSAIALDDDVARLLQKCREDPKNARRYANLILDIDPCNAEAINYL